MFSQGGTGFALEPRGHIKGPFIFTNVINKTIPLASWVTLGKTRNMRIFHVIEYSNHCNWMCGVFRRKRGCK